MNVKIRRLFQWDCFHFMVEFNSCTPHGFCFQQFFFVHHFIFCCCCESQLVITIHIHIYALDSEMFQPYLLESAPLAHNGQHSYMNSHIHTFTYVMATSKTQMSCIYKVKQSITMIILTVNIFIVIFLILWFILANNEIQNYCNWNTFRWVNSVNFLLLNSHSNHFKSLPNDWESTCYFLFNFENWRVKLEIQLLRLH